MTPPTPPHSLPRPIIVLVGGPGSGKGTHGHALAAALGLLHLSSGAHFRDHISRGTPLGLRARQAIENGKLAPDAVTADLVRAMLGGHPEAGGFILDGYPRSLAQAQALEEMAPAHGCQVERTLYLAISDAEMVRRLSGRLTCRACGRTCHETSRPPARPGVCDACGGGLFRRADDEPATILQRVALFHQMIEPLLEFYRRSGRLLEVSAEGPAHEVSARVTACLKKDHAAA